MVYAADRLPYAHNLTGLVPDFRGAASSAGASKISCRQSVILAIRKDPKQPWSRAPQRSAEIANNRYKAGLVSYLDVVFAQQMLLQNQQAVTQWQGQQAGSPVGLIRALSGGW